MDKEEQKPVVEPIQLKEVKISDLKGLSDNSQQDEEELEQDL